MNFRIYINYLAAGGLHAGVYLGDHLYYCRNAESGTSHLLRGYIEVTLNENVARTWNEIRRVVEAAFEEIGVPQERQIYAIVTPTGRMELLFRPGVPDNARDVVTELQSVFGFIQQGCDMPTIP